MVEVGVAIIILGVIIFGIGFYNSTGKAPIPEENSSTLIVEKKSYSLTVKPFTQKSIILTFPLTSANQTLRYNMSIEGGSITYRITSLEGKVIYTSTVTGKVNGTIKLGKPGSYRVTFDNTKSIIKSKQINISITMEYIETSSDKKSSTIWDTLTWIGTTLFVLGGLLVVIDYLFSIPRSLKEAVEEFRKSI